MNKNEMERLLKNYYRIKLKENKNKLIILSGKFKRIGKNYITFSTIRPYIKGFHTKTMCNHLNIDKNDVKKIINLSELKYNRKYYIIGHVEKYNNVDRYGLKLEMKLNYPPLFICDKITALPSAIYKMCDELDLNEYKRNKKNSIMILKK